MLLYVITPLPSRQVLPIVIFFSATISVLYYLGIMQTVISKIAWVMQSIMGTTAAESVNAAGNIFIGQVRSIRSDPVSYCEVGMDIYHTWTIKHMGEQHK